MITPRRLPPRVPNFARLSVLTAGQQALAAVAGILIVRSLPKDDYAQYSVTLGIVAAIVAVADAGVISTIMAEGGKLTDNRSAMLRLMRDGSRFRRVSYGLSALAFAPVLIYLLIGTKAEPGVLMLALALAMVTSFTSTTSAIYQATLRLEYRLTSVAFVLLGGAAIRCLLVVLAAYSFGSQVSFLILLTLTAIVTPAEAWFLRRLLGQLPALEKTTSAHRTAFRRNALRQVPNSIFFVAQGLILPLILIGVGNPLAIAEVNALSRYSIGFVVLASTITQIFMTRLARTREHTHLRIVYSQAVVLYISFGVAGLAIIVFAAPALLTILGDQYQGLGTELAIISLGGLVGGLVAVLAALNQARAWLRLAWVQIPLATVWITILLLVIRPFDAYSAAWFAALVAVPGIFSMALCAWLGMRDDRRRSEPTDSAEA